MKVDKLQEIAKTLNRNAKKVLLVAHQLNLHGLEDIARTLRGELIGVEIKCVVLEKTLQDCLKKYEINWKYIESPLLIGY